MHSYQLAEPLDLHWLATHCTALPDTERATLAERLLIDHELFDVEYFYESPTGKAFHAPRSGPTKALCLVRIDCLTAPVVEGECLKG